MFDKKSRNKCRIEYLFMYTNTVYIVYIVYNVHCACIGVYIYCVHVHNNLLSGNSSEEFQKTYRYVFCWTL